ncbi:MAG: hypothetical protein QXP59_04420 [Saccharolobus sp.]
MKKIITSLKLKEFLIVTSIIIISFLIFYFKLIFYMNGNFSFGNFSAPLNLDGFFSLQYLFFNPYTNFGTLNSFVLMSILYSYIVDFLELPSFIFGISIGTKILILFSSVIYGLVFYYFTNIFVKNFKARVIGTIFFLFNPFSISLYASGDFILIIFQSFLFISLIFTYLAMNKGKFFNPYFIIAAFFLIFNLSFEQSFIASLLMYLIAILYISFFSLNLKSFKEKLVIALKSFLVLFISLIFIGTIYYVPILFGPISLLPGTVNGLPVSVLYYGALPIWHIFTLKVYDDTLWLAIPKLYGNTFYLLWRIFEALLIIIFLFGFRIFNDKRLLYFSVLVLITSFFAAETDGPIFVINNLTVFLYENMLGYEAINYPYLWVWFLIVPFYSVILSIIISDFYDNNRKNYLLFKKISILENSAKKLKIKKLFKQISIYSFFTLVVFIIVIPISTQGYYNSKLSWGNTIHVTSYPQYFFTIENTLNNLTKNNNSGVIFNTVGSYIFFDNNSNLGISNIPQEDGKYRTASISSYIPNYDQVTNFLYWFYYLFYNNGTKYSAQILAMLGVQYFVDIYNANSMGYP